MDEVESWVFSLWERTPAPLRIRPRRSGVSWMNVFSKTSVEVVGLLLIPHPLFLEPQELGLDRHQADEEDVCSSIDVVRTKESTDGSQVGAHPMRT